MKKYLKLFLILFLCLPFQNCGPSGHQGDLDSQKLQSNGDPYSGVHGKAGTYYVFTENLDCGEGQSPVMDVPYLLRLEVPEVGSAILTDSCTGSEQAIDRQLVQGSINHNESVIFDDQVFQFHEGSIDQAPASRIVSQCYDKNSNEYLIKEIRGSSYFELSYFTATDIAHPNVSNLSEQLGDNFISFGNRDFELRMNVINSSTRSSGQILGNWLGRNQSIDLQCISEEAKVQSLQTQSI